MKQDPLANVLYDAYTPGEWKPYGPWNYLARAARERIAAEIEAGLAKSMAYGTSYTGNERAAWASAAAIARGERL